MNKDAKGSSASYSTPHENYKTRTSDELLTILLDELEAKTHNKNESTKLCPTTLFSEPDSFFEKSNQLIVIGGHPASRQISIAEDLVYQALESGLVCAYLGSKQGSINSFRRYLSKLSGIPNASMSSATLSEKQWERLSESFASIKKTNNLYAISLDSLTIGALQHALLALKSNDKKLKCLLISMTDFIQPFSAYSDLYARESIGTYLKSLCANLGISIIVTCFLSDVVEQKHDQEAYFPDFPVGLDLVDIADISILCERRYRKEAPFQENHDELTLTCLQSNNITTFKLGINEKGIFDIGKCEIV